MTPEELERALAQTLHDRQVSRSERKAFTQILADIGADSNERARLLSAAFKLAKSEVVDPAMHGVLDWLQDVTRMLRDGDDEPPVVASAIEAHFSPGEGCVQRIVSLIRNAQKSIDVCVFTITDDRISRALGEAHARRVAVRVVTDDEKALDQGSDALALSRIGVPVRVDGSPFHMHHKFAIFDRRTLLTGSYNWTRGAAESNEENLIVTGDDRLLRAFQGEFDRLWEKFEDNVLRAS